MRSFILGFIIGFLAVAWFATTLKNTTENYQTFIAYETEGEIV